MRTMAVLRVLLVSIWTWAPLLSAVLQSKLVVQLPSGFTAEGQAQQNEPGKPVLQHKLQPVMPLSVRVNPYPTFGQSPEDMMKYHQFWKSYFEYIHKNEQRGAQSSGFPTSGSPYRWQPQKPSQQESTGAQDSQRTPGGVGSGGGCLYCRGRQPTRTNVPNAHEQSPPRFQPWWSQHASQETPDHKPSQNPKYPHGSQGWGLHHQTGQQKPGQPSSSPSNAREAGPLSGKAYLFNPQGSQHGSGTSGTGQGVLQTKLKEFVIPLHSGYYILNPNYPSLPHQGGNPDQSQHQGNTSPPWNNPKQTPSLNPEPKQYSYENLGYHSQYQHQSSQDGPSEGTSISQDLTLQDMEAPEGQKANIGYQAWGSRKPGQSSYSSGRQVGNEQSSIKPQRPASTGQQWPYNQPKKPNLPTKPSRNYMAMPPPGYYLQPNIASQHYPQSKPHNKEQPSQWLSVRPPKQPMSPKQSEKPPSEGSAKFYRLPSRLIEQNALSKKDSQDENPQTNAAYWHHQGFSRTNEQSFGPDDGKTITVPPLGSDVVVSGAVFSRGQQQVGGSQNSRFSQTNEKQEESFPKAPAPYIYKHPYSREHFQQRRPLQ